MKKEFRERKEGKEKPTITVGDFNIPLSGIDRGGGKEERKGDGRGDRRWEGEGGGEGARGKKQRKRDGEREKIHPRSLAIRVM